MQHIKRTRPESTSVLVSFFLDDSLTVSVASAITAICACLSALSALTVSRPLVFLRLTGDILRALLERFDEWNKLASTPTPDSLLLPPPLMLLVIVSTRTRFSSSSVLRDKKESQGEGVVHYANRRRQRIQ